MAARICDIYKGELVLKRAAAALGVLCLSVGTVVVAVPAQAATSKVVLARPSAVLSGGAPVRLNGRLTGTGSANNKTVVLQRLVGGRWTNAAALPGQDDGPYAFVRRFSIPTVMVVRTVVKLRGKVLATSGQRTVTVQAPPPPRGSALLPDLVVRKLDECVPSARPCFSINRTEQPGVKKLKFPAVTANLGAGPFELRGERWTRTSVGWAATQRIRYSSGDRRDIAAGGAKFYFAGDGHKHWHVRDLDSYALLDASGTWVRVGEKHGFCFEDNTTYRDWPGNPAHPASPADPGVYRHETSCGEGQPQATSIVHGVSVGWADTYPTRLPDQYINVTGVPDGVYTVRVTSDQGNWFRETDERNNSASVQITIRGNAVTTVPGTATGS